ncbi:hypothetical protein [Paenibacillus arenosi]|uniref:Uncharacterized protein n=1 Tax=Paenibacillus arenosi TaxID=2774142 RepID=A0ABR9AU00_9BACL|nr:hypothetical protein [Paenibacillus arenosi]MBD8497487.1 hypothetical protein [Paenibacillus arenosi]
MCEQIDAKALTFWLQEVKRLNEALEGIMRITDGHGASQQKQEYITQL